ncbi:DUF5131 family protein [Actinopolymorpha alba]|uniref:DUF5131 family protein n=1 Tax=Actinopolymorpha alba TaxID=533267 RepID=UPI00307B52A3
MYRRPWRRLYVGARRAAPARRAPTSAGAFRHLSRGPRARTSTTLRCRSAPTARRSRRSTVLINLTGMHWLIAGGESGPNHRPLDPDWVRELRDACREQSVAFFFKQWGGRTPKSKGRELDGRLYDEMPAPTRA